MNTTTLDARQLSSGTIGSLIGKTDYATIDAQQAAFVEYCQENEGKFENWIAAWQAYDKILTNEAAYNMNIVRRGGSVTICQTRRGNVELTYNRETKRYTLVQSAHLGSHFEYIEPVTIVENVPAKTVKAELKILFTLVYQHS